MFACELTLVRIDYTRTMGDNSSAEFMQLSRVFQLEVNIDFLDTIDI